jgi:hypothetical protein
LLGAGVNIKAVSSQPGHASAALTLSTCAHLLPGADQDAARRTDDLLSGSKRVANQSLSVYLWSSMDRRDPTNSKGIQSLMDDPIKLEIFTDYV